MRNVDYHLEIVQKDGTQQSKSLHRKESRDYQ
jgi:hypothetical protein